MCNCSGVCIVYVVVDNGKACYDAGGILHAVHRTQAQAEASLAGFDRSQFDIERHCLDHGEQY